MLAVVPSPKSTVIRTGSVPATVALIVTSSPGPTVATDASQFSRVGATPRTVTRQDSESAPPSFRAVAVTVYVPGSVKV